MCPLAAFFFLGGGEDVSNGLDDKKKGQFEKDQMIELLKKINKTNFKNYAFDM